MGRIQEALFGSWLSEGSRDSALAEELRAEKAQNEFLSESVGVLEQTLMEDPGWRRLSLEAEAEFTRTGLDRLIDVSRAMYISHPLIQRSINVTAYYTWAQGVTFSSADDKVQELVIDPLVSDHKNRAELYSSQALLLTDVDQMIEGNIFFQLRTDPMGNVAVRSIPTNEIRDIYRDPEDKQQIMYYKRSWTENKLNLDKGINDTTTRTEYYPDWAYNPSDKPQTIGGHPVNWEAPIIHQRTGGTKHMPFGVPETYAALDWARAYKRFLEDWHSIVASLSRFAWRLSVKGNRMKDAKRKLASAMGDGGEEANPQVPAGAVAMGGDLTPIPKTGTTHSADDARASRLMVASAMNLPDTILSSDPQQGALATAKSLDRPTELFIMSRQNMWADLLSDIIHYRMRAMAERDRFQVPDDPGIEVTFPSILEHDTLETVKAIIAAATLEGKIEAGTMPRELLAKMLMEVIGVDDIEGALDELDEFERQDLDQAVDAMAEAIRGAVNR